MKDLKDKLNNQRKKKKKKRPLLEVFQEHQSFSKSKPIWKWMGGRVCGVFFYYLFRSQLEVWLPLWHIHIMENVQFKGVTWYILVIVQT